MIIQVNKLEHAVNIIIDELSKRNIIASWLNKPLGKEIGMTFYEVKLQTDRPFMQKNYKLKFGMDGEIPIEFIMNPNPNFVNYMNSFKDSKKLYIKILNKLGVDDSKPIEVKNSKLGILPKEYRNSSYLMTWSNKAFGSNWDKIERLK